MGLVPGSGGGTVGSHGEVVRDMHGRTSGARGARRVVVIRALNAVANGTVRITTSLLIDGDVSGPAAATAAAPLHKADGPWKGEC